MTHDNKQCKLCYGIRDALWASVYAVGLIGYGVFLCHFFAGGFQ